MAKKAKKVEDIKSTVEVADTQNKMDDAVDKMVDGLLDGNKDYTKIDNVVSMQEEKEKSEKINSVKGYNDMSAPSRVEKMLNDMDGEESVFTTTPSEFISEIDSIDPEDTDAIGDALMGIMRRSYVPVFEKKMIIEDMFNQSIVKDGANAYVDYFLLRMDMNMALISMYTNLDIVGELEEMIDVENVNDVYDILKSNGIFEAVTEMIEDSELEEINSILQSTEDTWNNKNKTTEAFISRSLEMITRLFGEYGATSSQALIDGVSDGTIPDNQGEIMKLAKMALEMMTQQASGTATNVDTDIVKNEEE